MAEAEGDRARAADLVRKALAMRAQDELEGAANALEAALQEDFACASAWGWLGEVRLRQGHTTAAIRCLAEARLLNPDWPRLHLWRAGLLNALGRPREASLAMERARALGLPRSERELPLAPAKSVPRAVDRRVAERPSAERFEERARALRDSGLPMEAVDDYSTAIALEPTALRYTMRGRGLFYHRHYELALLDFSRALALDPRCAQAYAARLEVQLCLERYAEAAADARAALKISPERSEIRLKLCEALALSGRRAAARKEAAGLEEMGVDAATARWMRGYLACLERDYRRAVPILESAAELAGSAALRERAGIHAVAAKLCVGGRRAKVGARGKGHLLVCGMGVRPPVSLTAEVVQALQSCDVVYKNVSGDEVSTLVRIVSRRCRPVMFRNPQDVPRTSALLLSEARRGRKVAFLTFGHPLIFGPLGLELLRRAREEGVSCTAFSAFSSIDSMLAGGGQALDFCGGNYQILSVMGQDVLQGVSRLNPKLATLLYFPEAQSGDGRRFAGFCRELLGRFPSRHPMLVFGPHHEAWEAPARRPIEELSSISQPLLIQSMVFILPIIYHDNNTVEETLESD